MNYLNKKFYTTIIFFLTSLSVFSQIELVPIDHKIYTFFENLSKRQIISYDNSQIPISREKASSLIQSLELSKEELTTTENKILTDLIIEFRYDINKSLEKSFSFLTDFDFLSSFNSEEQKYLYAYADENASLFFDGFGFLSFRDFNTTSFNKAKTLLGQAGVRIRGSLYNTIGCYIKMSNGQNFTGDYYARTVAVKYDPILAASIDKYIGQKYFGSVEGYIRYESENKVMSLFLGRDRFSVGSGYLDKLFLSDNYPPFDFLKLDINYKAIHGSFFYGNIKGDSLGKPLISKNIVGNRLDIKFSNYVRLGYFQSIIISNAPISFTYLNPVTFSPWSTYNAQIGNENNALMGFDAEVLPIKNVGVQFSLLIDDLNFSTIERKDSVNSDNKFAYQFGLFHSEPLGISNLSAIVEYTKIAPFVYAHMYNKSTYTHWGRSLGHSMPPNSDEIAIKLTYNLSHRINMNVEYKHQRSGEGFLVDKNGKVIRNFGGSILRGELDTKYGHEFLMGNRVNRNIVNFSIRIEPIRQYYFDFDFSYHSINNLFPLQNFSDKFFNATFSIDF